MERENVISLNRETVRTGFDLILGHLLLSLLAALVK